MPCWSLQRATLGTCTVLCIPALGTAFKKTRQTVLDFNIFSSSVKIFLSYFSAFRVNSDNPEQMCIGGSSTASRDLSQCGDFAG